jgi:hypothetical protein
MRGGRANLCDEHGTLFSLQAIAFACGTLDVSFRPDAIRERFLRSTSLYALARPARGWRPRPSSALSKGRNSHAKS